MQPETANAVFELFRRAVALRGGDASDVTVTLLRTDDDTAEERFAEAYADAPPPAPEPAYLGRDHRRN